MDVIQYVWLTDWLDRRPLLRAEDPLLLPPQLNDVCMHDPSQQDIFFTNIPKRLNCKGNYYVIRTQRKTRINLKKLPHSKNVSFFMIRASLAFYIFFIKNLRWQCFYISSSTCIFSLPPAFSPSLFLLITAKIVDEAEREKSCCSCSSFPSFFCLVSCHGWEYWRNSYKPKSSLISFFFPRSLFICLPSNDLSESKRLRNWHFFS